MGGIIVLSTFLVLGIIAGSVWLVTTKTNVGVLFQKRTVASKPKLELTAAEKGVNPIFDKKSADLEMQKGVEVIKDAIEADKERNWLSAIALYEQGIDIFMAVMKREQRSAVRFSIAKKVDKYLIRVKELKAATGGDNSGTPSKKSKTDIETGGAALPPRPKEEAPRRPSRT